MSLTELSVRDDHEPAPLVEHLTSAKLTDEFGSREGMSVHAMARTIAEDSLMPLLRGSVRATHILDDNELASDAAGVSYEPGALVRRQVVEEMAGEDPVELAVPERQLSDIPLEHTRVRHTGRSNRDHPSALVERHQLAAQMLREEARAACDIEHAGRNAHASDRPPHARSSRRVYAGERRRSRRKAHAHSSACLALRVGQGLDPLADLLRKLDDDSLRAADVAAPVAVLVALQLADEFSAAGLQAGNDGVDVLDGECDVADARRVRRRVDTRRKGSRSADAELDSGFPGT